jgi:hypothetical protein
MGVRRHEVSVRKRLEQFRELLDREPAEAGKIVEALLDGPLTFRPIETTEGKRYEVTGRIATGTLLEVLPCPQRECPQGNTEVSEPTLRPVFEDFPAWLGGMSQEEAGLAVNMVAVA